MLVRLGQSFIAVIWFVGLLPTVHGEPVPTDATGDPLPPGVVARLGTTRLFQPQIRMMQFAPDGAALAAIDENNLLCLWEVRSGKKLWQFQAPPSVDRIGLAGPIAFSADGKVVAIGCADKCVRLLETGSGKERSKVDDLKGTPSLLTFDPHGHYLAFLETGENSIQVVDRKTNKATEVGTHLENTSVLAFAADGKSLTAVRQFGAVQERVCYVWDCASGEQLRRDEFKMEKGFHECALSPDGTRLAATADVLRLLDPATGKEICRPEVDKGRSSVVTFSGDSKRVAALDYGGTVRVWDAANGKLLHKSKPLASSIDILALSSDGKLAALTGRTDGAIHLWDVAKAKELHAFGGHRGGRLTAAFSSDGKTVYTTSRDTSFQIPAWFK